jgi:predicted N-acetyltransferase YhbS
MSSNAWTIWRGELIETICQLGDVEVQFVTGDPKDEQLCHLINLAFDTRQVRGKLGRLTLGGVDSGTVSAYARLVLRDRTRSGQPIGHVGLYPVLDNHEAAAQWMSAFRIGSCSTIVELGRLVVAHEHRGSGLGRLLMREGVVEGIRMKRHVVAVVARDNVASIGAVLSAGLVEVAVLEAPGHGWHRYFALPQC